MYQYEIGGNERKIDISEGLNALSFNKTLFVQQLTDEEPIKPDAVEGLKTVEEVFDHYKPQVEVEFENLEGAPVREELKFRNVGDFQVKSMTKQSEYLNSLEIENDLYESLIKKLGSNRALITALNSTETKEAFIVTLKSFIEELENNL